MQLSFDVAADRLVAARLLRMQSAGASWAKSDPRRFDRAVAAVVETAQALAGAAHAAPPTERDAYWSEARRKLAPMDGPGTRQRWLARVALEWAAQGAPLDGPRLQCGACGMGRARGRWRGCGDARAAGRRKLPMPR
ncbi:hypothetical protein FSC37_10780 [Piscinibacter aquaticus]|uniref:Uncharacterized protein n=1 Tax=Piscinibacter aquaticus TaxID=392597 RepID=A0A5C6U0F2_9BURK|nr:hypothetical protein FSC37_10780 [Piscinibacter aquaticus]